MYKILFVYFLLSSYVLFSQNQIPQPSSITKIDLSNKGLTEFPIEILKYKNLVELDLSNNGLKSIPVELSELKNLKYLNLSLNQGLNQVDLKVVLNNAKFNLTVLDLSNCDLVDLPENLGNQTDLRELYLSHNNLISLPYSYTELNKLTKVDLSNNYFNDLNWLIKFWWNIKYINLKNNKELS